MTSRQLEQQLCLLQIYDHAALAKSSKGQLLKKIGARQRLMERTNALQNEIAAKNGQPTVIDIEKDETVQEMDISHPSTLNLPNSYHRNAERATDDRESKCKTAPPEFKAILSGGSSNVSQAGRSIHNKGALVIEDCEQNMGQFSPPSIDQNNILVGQMNEDLPM